MKFFLLTSALSVAFNAVYGQEGCDCTPQINEHLIPVIEQRDAFHRDVETLLQQREQLIRERDELHQSREQTIQERDTLYHEKEELARLNEESSGLRRQLDEHTDALGRSEIDHRRLQAQIMELQKSVERSAADREHFQKVAQENQHYMQEYKVRLATMRDKSAKLDLELEKAYAKIKELESATLGTKIKKEVAAGIDSLMMFMGRHKEETPDDL